MDYGELLYKAHENHKNAFNKEVRCYKTSFSPPKKLERSKVSSVNIKKFLARKEEEDKKKNEEAARKREELLALRSQDKKAQRRVQVMLKSTKSANKSVMADAIDNVNTADTLNGFKQCDEDDYGYVSQEASAFYNKLLNKYENMPAEPPKFKPAKKEVKDLIAAKDRVRAALQKEADEELLPHKRKKKKNDASETDDGDIKKSSESVKKTDDEIESKKEVASKTKHKKSAAPPPMNFDQLLQIAQKKQFEPILIDEAILKKEPERLMTKKEKLEYEREVERKTNKGKPVPTKNNNEKNTKDEMLQKTPSNANDSKKKKSMSHKQGESKSDLLSSKKQTCPPTIVKEKPLESKEIFERLKKDGSVYSQNSNSPHTDTEVKCKPTNNKTITSSTKSNNIKSTKLDKKVDQKVIKPEISSTAKSPGTNKEQAKMKELEIQLLRERCELLETKKKLKELEMQNLLNSEKKESKKKIVPKKPPLPIKKPIPEKKKAITSKRRIDSESEEYDSELDDFIDDGPDETNDYSKYISEIFGYDKSRYADCDDDICMESNFAQISKEEFVSTRIGIMEDLEDMKKEQEEKRRSKAKKLKRLAEEKKKHKK